MIDYALGLLVIVVGLVWLPAKLEQIARTGRW